MEIGFVEAKQVARIERSEIRGWLARLACLMLLDVTSAAS
jgi:hypothetical protein